MFAGIVQGTGRVTGIADSPAGKRLAVAAPEILGRTRVGESVGVDGVCLTVAVCSGPGEVGFDVIPATLTRTTLGGLRAGDPVNLETAMAYGDPVGGHLVQGHVDGVATVVAVEDTPDGGYRVRLTLPEDLLPDCVPRGSIALGGVSLTIAELEPPELAVALIPTTLELTTFGSVRVGDRVNVETDMFAKHLRRLLEPYLERLAGSDPSA